MNLRIGRAFSEPRRGIDPRPLCALLLGLLWASVQPSPAGAERVRVQVVDAAASLVYLHPGEHAGLRVGTRVQFARRSYRVTAVSGSSAVIEAPQDPPAVGTRGIARVTRTRTTTDSRAVITPLRAFRGQWPSATRPATRQTVRYVPLAGGARGNRVDASISTSVDALLPLGGGPSLVRSRIRGTVHAEPVAGTPLSLDADAAVQLYAGVRLSQRAGGPARPVLRVRELQVSYGEEQSFYAATGRLRNAAMTVGQLDGLRLQTPSLSGITVGAFGGFVPDPRSGVPRFDAARFGTEIRYQDSASDWLPSLQLVAMGSLFEGSLDERRINGTVRLSPKNYGFGSHFEISLFDADNPWNAASVELSALGLDFSGTAGPLRYSVRVDARKPERSRWLAEYLPASFICYAPENAGTFPVGTCSQLNDTRYMAAAHGDLQTGPVTVTAGGQYTRVGAVGVDQLFLYSGVRAPDLAGVLRFDAIGQVSLGSFLQSYAVRLGTGFRLFEGALDIGLYYRPVLRRYEADVESALDHAIGLNVWGVFSEEWQVALHTDALFGRDVNALLVGSQLTWKPTR